MRLFVTAAVATSLALPAAAYGGAARALISEFGINTQSVSKVESNLYEVAYSDTLLVTSNCWVSAYADTAVVTSNQIIFIDANETCWISGTQEKTP